MPSRMTLVSAVSAALCLSTAASAAVTMYTEAALYDSAAAGLARAAETFSGFPDGTYGTPLSGTAGPVAWTATAAQGLLVNSSRLSALDGQAMLITFAAGGLPIRGVSGNFFATVGGAATSAEIQVELSDGTSQIESISDPGSFMGFLSSSGSISSIRISIYSASGAVNPTVGNLDFAYVPSPGGLALLAVSALFAPRRRR